MNRLLRIRAPTVLHEDVKRATLRPAARPMTVVADRRPSFGKTVARLASRPKDVVIRLLVHRPLRQTRPTVVVEVRESILPASSFTF